MVKIELTSQDYLRAANCCHANHHLKLARHLLDRIRVSELTSKDWKFYQRLIRYCFTDFTSLTPSLLFDYDVLRIAMDCYEHDERVVARAFFDHINPKHLFPDQFVQWGILRDALQ